MGCTERLLRGIVHSAPRVVVTSGALSGLLLAASGCVEGDGIEATSRAVLDESTDDPSVVGRWDPRIIDGQTPAVHMSVLSDGRVLYWDGTDAVEEHEFGEPEYIIDWANVTGHIHHAQSRILEFDGDEPLVYEPPNADGGGPDLFCSSHAQFPDGRLFTVGGTIWEYPFEGGDAILTGTTATRVFDPALGNWQDGTDMLFPRWYPGMLTLPDGDHYVVAGAAVIGNELQTAIERHDWQSGTWSHLGDWHLPLYPRISLVPAGPYAGKVFYSTAAQLWGPMGFDPPLETLWALQQVGDPVTGEQTLLGPSLLGARNGAVGVMLHLRPENGYRAQVLTFGGTVQRTVAAIGAAELTDLGTSPPTNELVEPLEHGRWMANGILLPDGTTLAIGGAVYDNSVAWGQPNVHIMHAEQFDPRTKEWTTLAPMQVPRGYHHTAALLPDGRVLAGGHSTLAFWSGFVRNTFWFERQITEKRLEIFEPPYLFRGTRPTIKNAPAEVTYGSGFKVQTSHASEISSMVLIRPASTTHGYDMEQRAIYLDFAPDGDGQLRAVAPPSGLVAPPGHYMLFVNRMTPEGETPSKAVFVKLGS